MTKDEVYHLQMPMSPQTVALGWAAFGIILLEIGTWYDDPGSVELEYRHHGGMKGYLITSFRVRRSRPSVRDFARPASDRLQ